MVTQACTAVCPANDCTIEYRDSEGAQAYAKETLKAERLAKKAAKSPVKGVVKPATAAQPDEAPRPDLSVSALQQRLLEETAAKKGKKKKGPFGF